MAADIKKLTNANVYLDGASLLGKAEEIDLPNITHKLAEHKALGMIGTPEFFSGIDKMEARIKWSSLYADVLKKASNPTKTVQLQVRASLETYEASGRTGEQPVVVFLTAQFKNIPTGNYKQHENSEFESSLTVFYVKMEIDGAEIMEVDVLANIYKVDGVDVLANYRANLGI